MIEDDELNTIFDTRKLESEMNVAIDQARYDEIMENTPPSFIPIAHYAALWGIRDDRYRGDLIRNSSHESRQNLKFIVSVFEDELEKWLAGSEAGGPEFSEAYIAFTRMIMACYEIL